MAQKDFDEDQDFNLELLDRRKFLGRLGFAAGGAAAVFALPSLLGSNTAKGEIVSKDDPRLVTEYIKYPGATGDIRAYSARPKGAAKLPAVLVIHENRGLVPHIEDVTRRFALEGFLALAPDGLTPLGGTQDDPEKAPALIQKLDMPSTIQNYVAAAKFLKTHPVSTGKVGVVGFCWGGAMANQMAVNSPDVSAVVPYYGKQPTPEDVPKIKGALLIHYAGIDQWINGGIPAFEAALKKAGVDYKQYIYEGAQHAFNNDTSARYHKEAALLAWQRTGAFFKEKLK
ncbi:MAG: dienelactone hydrolase family protein [Deltaproteobacteria bacterium]|nr:dienelactone hydrolase family protein [Deltaproteobacteria bacterium]